MEKGMQTGVVEDMEATALRLRDMPDSAAFVHELAAFLGRMEEVFFRLAHQPPEAGAEAGVETETALYRRALQDYLSLQKHLSSLREPLSTERAFAALLRGKGREKAKALQHIHLVEQLDYALGDLVHLMQYDEPGRCEIDVRNGFQINCGSVNYGRMRFAQRGEEVDD